MRIQYTSPMCHQLNQLIQLYQINNGHFRWCESISKLQIIFCQICLCNIFFELDFPFVFQNVTRSLVIIANSEFIDVFMNDLISTVSSFMVIISPTTKWRIIKGQEYRRTFSGTVYKISVQEMRLPLFNDSMIHDGWMY